MTTTIYFFEGSEQFKSVDTDLNVHNDYIEMILAKQFEYRPTSETLWAKIMQKGKEVDRFQFSYTEGLTRIILD